MPASPTLSYAADSDSSLSRAAAVCHWVAIGVLAAAAFNENRDYFRDLLGGIQFAHISLSTWHDRLDTACALASVASLLAAFGAFVRRRWCLYLWIIATGTSLLVTLARGLFYALISDTGQVYAALNGSDYWFTVMEVVGQVVANPQLLLLVLFSRSAIVRARWVR